VTTHSGFTNVFLNKEGHRYLSGIIHETAQDAVEAQLNPRLKGKVIGVAQVVWEEPEPTPR
jgi:hypothetical protein